MDEFPRIDFGDAVVLAEWSRGPPRGSMCGMRTVVLGAGPAGCVTALGLARRGHDVTLIDRDDNPVASTDRVFDEWDRPTVGQFRQPHNFLGLGRAILRDDFPDVYAELLATGAGEIAQDAFLGEAPREPGDENLATIACRRPIFDAVLRAAVARQSGVTFRAAAVKGLAVENRPTTPHVTGVRLTSDETIGGDLVVDASGRNSTGSRWLEQAGGRAWIARSFDCQLLYYSRHYRYRGEPLPYASILGGPRGDVGFLAFAVFLGDNSTFCLCVMAPVWEKEWRALRDPDAFERVARELPGMAAWLDAAEPITHVLPMGQLHNTVRLTVEGDAPLATGLIPIGDARCHTNPTFAFGVSLGISHARTLVRAIDSADNDADLAMTFANAVDDDAVARFEAVSAEDRDRIRLWTGEPINPTDRLDTMPLFLRTVVYRASAQDPVLLRAVCRRINLLDPVDALPSDHALLDRAEALFKELPPATPVPRGTVLAALHGV
jgi:2-polyprenyl-6-methoxyphenol hydroxylase-like FAD-dependent oxidoreductase